MTADYRSLFYPRAQKDGMVLATFYNGIGDAIVHAPIVASLRRSLGDSLVLPETSACELTDLSPDLCGIRRVPGHFRRLHSQPRRAAIDGLKAAGIGAVLNFRRDRVVDCQRYQAFADAMANAGIYNRDACAAVDVTHQASIHTYRLAVGFLAALGLPPPKTTPAWLAPFVTIEKERQTEIGIFLGASVPIKRLPPAFWHSLVRALAQRLHLRPLLIAGSSPDEQMLAEQVSAGLTRDGVQHSVAPPRSLRQVAGMIASLPGVITGDSFVLPLAEAVGTRVVAIHCATDSRVYGVTEPANISLQSPFYPACPDRNSVGNCNGWERGCAHLRCQKDLDITSTIEAAATVFAGYRR